jgi:hypothetical protein
VTGRPELSLVADVAPVQIRHTDPADNLFHPVDRCRAMGAEVWKRSSHGPGGMVRTGHYTFSREVS